MLKRAVGKIIRKEGSPLKAALPEADFFISNTKIIKESVTYGDFKYDPQDQFATFVKETSTEPEADSLLKKAFQVTYESGGVAAVYDLYNRINERWCSQCDTYTPCLDEDNTVEGGSECLACGRQLTHDEVQKTIVKRKDK
jgi:hypothetical protein